MKCRRTSKDQYKTLKDPLRIGKRASECFDGKSKSDLSAFKKSLAKFNREFPVEPKEGYEDLVELTVKFAKKTKGIPVYRLFRLNTERILLHAGIVDYFVETYGLAIEYAEVIFATYFSKPVDKSYIYGSTMSLQRLRS